jgi:transmembrane sensor
MVMNDIYTLLGKHFANNLTSEEESLVEKFRKDNPLEYDLLRKLWKTKDIKIQDFDAQKSWKEIMSKTTKTNKIIPFLLTFRKIAAVALILIISSIAFYFIKQIDQNHEYLVLKNTTEQPIELKLFDGSDIWLNSGAELEYYDDYNDGKRLVSLSGNAFFTINTDSLHPFIISTANSEIKVLGTSFNVNSKNKKTEVNVKTGIVEVSSSDHLHKVKISQNQTAVVDDKKLTSFTTEDINFLAWKTGEFEFINIPLKQVIEDLNTYYSNQIEFDSSQEFDCNLTASFKDTDLDDVLQIIALSCNLSVETVNNKYKISY